jgi:hypothetical protein
LLEVAIPGDGSVRYVEIADRPIVRGADVNRADREGFTLLAHARQRRHEALAARLEKASAR